MRFLLDESADYPLTSFLQSLGHDVTSIAHDYPAALKDIEVLKIATNEQRTLITNDKDFGELIFRRQLPHAGVILFRLADEELSIKQDWLVWLLSHYSDQLNQFIVISDRGIRIRRSMG
jgi:predicted nuclease of predicted toxin-antitoxin system